MVATAPGVEDIDVYSREASLARNALERQFLIRSQALQAMQPAGPNFASRRPTADKSPLSVGMPRAGFQHSSVAGSPWLPDALRALAEVDDEIAEDGLPQIGPAARKGAERIIVALARHPWAPTVYPTQDAENCHPLQVAGFAQLRGHPARQPRTRRMLRLHRRAQSPRPLRRRVGPARRFRHGAVARLGAPTDGSCIATGGPGRIRGDAPRGRADGTVGARLHEEPRRP